MSRRVPFAALLPGRSHSSRTKPSTLPPSTPGLPMVLFFTPRGAETTQHVIYVGRDKFENEELIGMPHLPFSFLSTNGGAQLMDSSRTSGSMSTS